MGIAGRDRMMKSLDALTGNRFDCAEAILMQSRPWWVAIATVAAGLTVLVLDLLVGLPVVLAAAVAGGASGLTFTTITTYWILGRTSEGVVVARSSQLRAKATSITKTFQYPVPVEVDSALLSQKVTIDGDEYFVGRPFMTRFDSIVGRA